MLNEEIVYGGLCALASVYPTHVPEFAFFTTYDHTTWRDSRSVRSIWKRVRSTSFWTRRVILVPIHDVNHWMLAIVRPQEARIDILDSLADDKLWEEHAKHTADMMTALFHEAEAVHDIQLDIPTPWVAAPLEVEALQTSNYRDCGVWVLVVAAALLKGKQSTGLSDDEIPAFRRFLYHAIATLGPST
ncbi:cysteine proteinase [Exidia glandulosa HHB12029]|uniref:Cysteine proteinase n=1 Tax=Exidia glandulosa HHB12029 TaxID=1314781 RepID=A0A165K3S8_EXIGL|nr:cysteine proteinase [Exidia glandulosa HHB12029]